MKAVLIDTGPLVAFLDRRDPEHTRTKNWLEAFSGHLVTSGAVITEAMHFVSHDPEGPYRLADLVETSGMLVYDCTQPHQLKNAAALMKKYADTPMDFADATLVLLSEVVKSVDIATLDRRGFTTYRTQQGKAFKQVL